MFVSNWICKFKFQLIGKSSHEKPKYNLFYFLLSNKISKKKGFINGIGNLIWYGVSHRNVKCKLGDIELTNYWALTSYFWRMSQYKIYFTGTYVIGKLETAKMVFIFRFSTFSDVGSYLHVQIQKKSIKGVFLWQLNTYALPHDIIYFSTFF